MHVEYNKMKYIQKVKIENVIKCLRKKCKIGAGKQKQYMQMSQK